MDLPLRHDTPLVVGGPHPRVGHWTAAWADDEESLCDVDWLDLVPGPLPRRVAGRYLLAWTIGSGGFGTVYCARDELMGEWIAIKALQPAFAAHPKARARLIREVELARRISHPNVVRVHDLVSDGDELFFTMAHVPGRTLGRQIDEEGPLTWLEAVCIGARLADALQAVHEAGIVHCDVKCDNVVIDCEGQPRLLDFGVARLPEDPPACEGTPEYMAPEQRARGRVDARTDVYGLGMLLLEVLVGRPTVRDPRHRSRVPDGLAGVVMRCIAADPADRYGSAAEVARALRGPSLTAGSCGVHQ
jgi:eukaryotic-like serine/threonine-protein kinase